MSKFTPGPWTIECDESGPDAVSSIRSEHGYHLAEVTGGIGLYLPGDGDSRGNARLIAAAPEAYYLLDQMRSDPQLCEVWRGYINNLLEKIDGEPEEGGAA